MRPTKTDRGVGRRWLPGAGGLDFSQKGIVLLRDIPGHLGSRSDEPVSSGSNGGCVSEPLPALLDNGDDRSRIHTALPGRGSNAKAEADTFLRLEDLWQSQRGTLATRQTSGQLALRAPDLSVPPRRRAWGVGACLMQALGPARLALEIAWVVHRGGGAWTVRNPDGDPSTPGTWRRAVPWRSPSPEDMILLP